MRSFLTSLLSLCPLATLAASSVTSTTVKLDRAIVQGSRVGNTVQYLGIPFAKPPVGKLRFAPPKPVQPYSGLINATAFGPSCPQQDIERGFTLPSFAPFDLFAGLTTNGLSINVFVPAGAKPGDNLPVATWIYGGGFEIGMSSTTNGSIIVERSLALNQPVILVSMNYRVSAWGFLASKEVKEAGISNAGFHDQRLALSWVKKYIKSFGGDPSKVTLWGVSAGSTSVAYHMLHNGGNTEGLFRGAIMMSGSPLSIGDVTNGQKDYDLLVERTGCTGSDNTLDCLQHVPQNVLQQAADLSPSFLTFNTPASLAWMPRVDGVLFNNNPQQLVKEGKFAKIPFINGDCDDEGTLFSLTAPLVNITNDAQFAAYMQSDYFPKASANDIAQLVSAYPSDPAAGSPYDTGDANAATPEYKRISSFQGDLIFQGPRRLFLSHAANRQPTWSYANKRLKAIPIFGAFHGCDIPQFFQSGEMQDYAIHFFNGLDPNFDSTLMKWPKYTLEDKELLVVTNDSLALEPDTYRDEALVVAQNIFFKNPT